LGVGVGVLSEGRRGGVGRAGACGEADEGEGSGGGTSGGVPETGGRPSARESQRRIMGWAGEWRGRERRIWVSLRPGLLLEKNVLGRWVAACTSINGCDHQDGAQAKTVITVIGVHGHA
jgi:hypothetical protein